MGVQLARERRAHVHGRAQRAGHATPQGTKPPLYDKHTRHSAWCTLHKHLLCLAATIIWRK